MGRIGAVVRLRLFPTICYYSAPGKNDKQKGTVEFLCSKTQMPYPS